MPRLRPENAEVLYEQRREAAKLKRGGMTWDEVAAELALPGGRGQAFNMVKALMKEHQSLSFDEIGLYRQESLDRLSALLKAQWPRAMDGDDKATTQCRLIISQIGDLTGEKAPVQVQIGESDVDRALRELTAELDRRGAVQAPGEAASAQEADR